MRILLSCLQDLRPHRIPAYKFFATYFRNGISEAGHEWLEVPFVDWAEGCTSLTTEARRLWLDRTWETTVDWVKREQCAGRAIDLFLSYLYPSQVEPAAIALIQGLGIRCVNFFCDNVREFTRVPSEYRCFDLHWVPEYEALKMYARAGLKVCHLPMPVWISPRDRDQRLIQDDSAVFIGSCDPLRRDLLARALEMGAPLKIYGPGWVSGDFADDQIVARSKIQILRNQIDFLRKRGFAQWARRTTETLLPDPVRHIASDCIFPPSFGPDYVRLTQTSTVTIGINRVPTFVRPRTAPLKYSRLRDIEAPMMGACYLTEWTEGLGSLYSLGEDIETYRTAEEMAQKVNELRSDPAKCRRLRANGQRRALGDLSVPRSMAKLISSLG